VCLEVVTTVELKDPRWAVLMVNRKDELMVANLDYLWAELWDNK